MLLVIVTLVAGGGAVVAVLVRQRKKAIKTKNCVVCYIVFVNNRSLCVYVFLFVDSSLC